jgi:hypothetical protein
MKFGKEILVAATASRPLCHEDQWLDYKVLKKVIKDSIRGRSAHRDSVSGSVSGSVNGAVAEEAGSEGKASSTAASVPPAPQDAAATEKALRESGGERVFFLLLRKELRKVAQTFKELERRAYNNLVLLAVQVREQLSVPVARSLKVTAVVPLAGAAVGDTGVIAGDGAIDPRAAAIVMQRCVDMHLSLLMLENYAVLNYAGFVKILKKHDKATGLRTMDQYLQKMVRNQEFVSHPWLQSAISSVESDFKLLASLIEADEPQQKDNAQEAGSGLKRAVEGGDSDATPASKAAKLQETVPLQQPAPQSAPSQSTKPTAPQSQPQPPTLKQQQQQQQQQVRPRPSSGSDVSSGSDSAKVPTDREPGLREKSNPGSANPSPRGSGAGSANGSLLANRSADPELHRRLLGYHSSLERDKPNWVENVLSRNNSGEQLSSLAKEGDDKKDEPTDKSPVDTQSATHGTHGHAFGTAMEWLAVQVLTANSQERSAAEAAEATAAAATAVASAMRPSSDVSSQDVQRRSKGAAGRKKSPRA